MLGSSENFRLGILDIAPNRNAVIAGDQNIRLEPKVMDVLCLLAQSKERVVLREDLINQVWSVESGADESLTRAISLLRKTLKQCGNTSTIETIPKRGYRLVTDEIDPSLSDFTLPDKLGDAASLFHRSIAF